MGKVKYKKEEIESAVASAVNLNEVFINLGLKPNAHSGHNSRWMNGLIKKFDVSTGHFEQKSKFRIKYETGDISNGLRISSEVLNKFMQFYETPYKCNDCDLNSWKGEGIVLDVDHINNDPTDNKIENLQYLCPNCHRLKTKKESLGEFEKRKATRKKFCECGKGIAVGSTYCQKCVCNHREKVTKIVWPSRDFFVSLVWSKTSVEIAKDLGVSTTTLRKFLRKNFIPFPTLSSGYWPAWNAGKFEKCKTLQGLIEADFANTFKS